MILLTSAGSRTQRHIIPALARRGQKLRAAGRSLEADWLVGHGVDEIVTLDLLDRTALDNAMCGVRQVIHVGPPLQSKETAIGQFVIDAAAQAGVRRFIYISVINPQIESLLNHRSKLMVEDYLIRSGLNYTILQPQHYFQNISIRQAIADGRFTLPYSLERRLGFVDMADLAEAAAIVTTEPEHDFATYQISGSDFLSGSEIAEMLTRISGRQVAAEKMALSAAAERLASRCEKDPTQRDWSAHAALRLYSYYDRYGIRGNSNVLRWILSRPPTTFEIYVRRVCDPS